MRRLLIASTSFAAALLAGVLASGPGLAEPAAPPVTPYKAVAVKPAAPVSDAGFVALRKQLGDIANRKDRTGLAKLIVAKGFFWLQDRDLADASKPAIENLAKAITLDAKDGSGWDALASYASEPSGTPMRDHAGVICSPALPIFDSKEFDAIVSSTKTDAVDWGFIVKDGTEVRGTAAANGPVIDKLGTVLVRVMMDDAPPADAKAPTAIRIATPSGKTGFVPVDVVYPLASDQMCFVKEGGNWKIAGYVGGADQ